MLDKTIEQQLIKGEIVILEKKNEKETENVTFTKEEFREFIGYQDNLSIMDDCVILLQDSQIQKDEYIYRLIHGKRLVVNMFEEYSRFFIDAINENIDNFGLDGDV